MISGIRRASPQHERAQSKQGLCKALSNLHSVVKVWSRLNAKAIVKVVAGEVRNHLQLVDIHNALQHVVGEARAQQWSCPQLASAPRLVRAQ